jgi:NifU-like protein
MGQEALEAAIYKYKGINLETHEEDEGNLICRCFGVTDAKIKRIIQENNLITAEQVTNYVKAGGGCSSCLPDIDDLLEEITTEKEKSVEMATDVWSSDYSLSPKPSSTSRTTKPLTNLQKISLIQKVIDTEIRPVLAEDGGDMELFDVEGDTVKVILKGACNGCASSTETLKLAIEATLKDRVLSTLVVEAV